MAVLKPVRGNTVELLIDNEQWALATVTQTLSTQFLCRVGKGIERFYFYSDEGVTWRKHNEE